MARGVALTVFSQLGAEFETIVDKNRRFGQHQEIADSQIDDKYVRGSSESSTSAYFAGKNVETKKKKGILEIQTLMQSSHEVAEATLKPQI